MVRTKLLKVWIATIFIILAIIISSAATEAENASQTEPVVPLLEYVFQDDDGQYMAVFGYLNPNNTVIDIPIGPHNKFTPAPVGKGQPTLFQPGRVMEAFEVKFDGNKIDWHLHNLKVSATCDFQEQLGDKLLLIAKPRHGQAPLTVNFLALHKPSAFTWKYQWDFNNDGVIDQETNQNYVKFTYNQPGVYQAKVIATRSDGMRLVDILESIGVKGSGLILSLAAQPLQGLGPLDVTFTANLNSTPGQSGDSLTYAWDFNNDGVVDQTSFTNVITYRYDNPGKYQAKVSVTAKNGKTGSATSGEILVDALRVNLNATVQSGFAPLAVNFSATTNYPVTLYQWDFDLDGRIDRETTSGETSFIFGQPANFEVKLIVTNGNGIKAESIITIQVERLIFAAQLSVIPVKGLAPFTINLTANLDRPEVQAVSYAWDFNNDGTIDQTTTGNNVSHTYNTPGNYLAKVTVTDIVGTTATATSEAIQAEALAVEVTATPMSGYVPLLVSFSAATNYPGAVFKWDFNNDGQVDQETNSGEASYLFNQPGDYLAKVTVITESGISATKTIPITVQRLSFNAALMTDQNQGFTPLEVKFNATIDNPQVQVVNYSWDFESDGVIDQITTVNTTSHIYLSPGVFLAKVIVADIVGTTAEAGSGQITVEKIQAPASLRASAGPDSITVTWERVSGATGYELEVDGSIVDTSLNVIYQHNGLVPGSAHTYRVRTKAGAIYSEWSPFLNQTTPLPIWVKIGDMPSTTGEQSAIALDGKIYLVVGIKGTISSESTYLNRYDPVTGQWDCGNSKDMDLLCRAIGMAAINGKVYAFTNYYGFFEEYEPEKDYGRTLLFRYDTSRAVQFNEKVYIFSKYNEQFLNDPFNVYEFDPTREILNRKTKITNKSDYALAVANNKLYVIGGVQTVWGMNYLDTIEEYDPATNQWTLKTKMPTPRSMCRAVVVDNKIYVIGGYNGSKDLKTVEIYNPNTDSWSRGPELTEARRNFGVETVNRQIYVFGGSNQSGALLTSFERLILGSIALPSPENLRVRSIQINQIEISWDPVGGADGYQLEIDGAVVDVGNNIKYIHNVTDGVFRLHSYRVRARNNSLLSVWSYLRFKAIANWENKISLPKTIGGYYSDVTAFGDRIYAFPGRVMEYNPQTDVWSLKKQTDEGISAEDLGAIVCNNKIYLLGSKNKKTIEYDPIANSLVYKSYLPDEMCVGNYLSSSRGVASLNGRIYVFGGKYYYSGSHYLNSVYEYNPVTDTWLSKNGMPEALSGCQAVTLNGKIYLLGGEKADYTKTNSVMEYDPNTDSWIPKAPMNVAHYIFNATVLNNRIYILDGRMIEEYDPVTDTWTILEKEPGDPVMYGMVGLNGTLYIFGNDDGNTSDNLAFGPNFYNLSLPNGFYVSNLTSTSLQLNWSSVVSANSYELQIDGTIIDLGFANSYIHSNLEAGSTHVYRVRAKNAEGVGPWSSMIKTTTLPAIPRLLKIDQIDANRFDVYWEPVTGAVYYQIEADGYIQSALGDHAQFYQNANLPYHSFRIRAYNYSGVSEWGTMFYTCVTLTANPSYGLIYPLTVSFSAYCTSPQIQPVLYEWDFNDDGITDQTTKDATTNYTYISANSNQARVTITDISGSKAQGKVVIINASTIPANLTLRTEDGNNNLSWSSIANATGYEVEIDSKILVSVNSTSYSEPVEPQTFHNYRVRAKYNNVSGPWSHTTFLVKFESEPYVLDLNQKATFSTTVIGLETQPVSYNWDFNDDGIFDLTTSQGIFTHSFAEFGERRVIVEVTDQFGTKVKVSTLIWVNPSTIKINSSAYPSTGNAPLKVVFTNNVNSDNGTIGSFCWDFDGDGNIDWRSDLPETITHVYSKPGKYLAILKVYYENSNSFSGVKVFPITVQGSVANIDFNIIPVTGPAPLDVSFTTNAAISDGYVLKYEWDFEGDGQFDLLQNITSDGNNISFDAESGLTGFSTTGTWGILLYNTSNCYTDSPNGNYENNSNNILSTREIDLTWAVQANLEFSNMYNVETNYDFCLVELSKDNGNSWIQLKSYTGYSSYMWVKELISLNSFIGQKILVRFRLVSDAANQYDGWYLDNILFNINSVHCNHIYNLPDVYRPVLRITDNLNRTFTKTGEVLVLQQGSPMIVSANATITKGMAPLTVSLSAEVINPTDIIQYQWDFDNDGIFDWSSTSSANTSFTYQKIGIYLARLRVTNKEGLSAESKVKIEVNLEIKLAGLAEGFNPESNEKLQIKYSINADALMTVKIINREGMVLRTIIENQTRIKGENLELWDGKDEQGQVLPGGVYFVILKGLSEDGREFILDLSNTFETGMYDLQGVSLQRQMSPFKDEFLSIPWYQPKRGLVTLYISDYATRIKTLFVKRPYLSGNHSFVWDGTNDSNQMVTYRLDGYTIGDFYEALPQNAVILLVNEPEIIALTATPNYLHAGYNAYQELPGPEVSQINVNFSLPIQVTMTIHNEQGQVVRTITTTEYLTEQVISWDGTDDNGVRVAAGIYNVEIRGKSLQGHESLPGRVYIMIYF